MTQAIIEMTKLLAITIMGLILSGNAYAGWFDKDKIKVTSCYETSKFKSYKAAKKTGKFYKKWEWELNLKDKIAYHITVKNSGDPLEIEQHKIKIITDQYIIVSNANGFDHQFDSNNQAYIVHGIQFKCKFS